LTVLMSDMDGSRERTKERIQKSEYFEQGGNRENGEKTFFDHE
jgi:hypothetical protein